MLSVSNPYSSIDCYIVTELFILVKNFFAFHLHPYGWSLQAREEDKEVDQAKALIAEYGEEKARFIIEFAVEKAKETKFDMQHFGAVLNYTGKAIGRLEKFEKRKEAKRREEKERRLETEYALYCIEQENQCKDSLPPDELKHLSFEEWRDRKDND